MVLGHHDGADHTPRFAYVHLVRPVPVIRIFVLRVSPPQHLPTDGVGDARIVSDKIEKPFRVVLVEFSNPFALRVIRFRIVPVFTDHVGRKTAGIIDIRLAVRHSAPDKNIVRRFPRKLLLQPYQQLVPLRIVVVRAGDFNPVLRTIGKRDAEIIGLHFFVPRPVGQDRIGIDAVQQSAGAVPSDDIRVDPVGKLVAVHPLRPVVGFAVPFITFPTDGVGNPGARHQIPFVTAIDKYLCAYRSTGRRPRRNGVFERDIPDHSAPVGRPDDPAVVPHLHIRPTDVLVENGFRFFRFENPLFELAVMPAQPTVEIERQAPDDVFVPDIGISQPSGTHSAQMTPRLDQQNALPGLPGRIGGYDAGRGSAVNANIHLFHILSL